MDNVKLINNYASALFESAYKYDMQEEVLKQIITIEQAINSDAKIKEFMCSPIVKNTDKIRVANLIIQNWQIQAIAEQFLYLLIKNGRISVLTQIISGYCHFLNRKKNIKMVKLTSSKILGEEERKWFQAYLESQLKQKILVNFNYDESLIGGIIIQYDSILIDCSIAGSLKKIERIAKNVKIFSY